MKPGYKQTEVGVIPEDWEVISLGDLFTSTQLGGNYQNTETVTGWPLIKMGNLGRGYIKLEKLEYVTPQTPPSQKDRLKTGDVLFNTRNTVDLVGKVAIWRDELREAYFNSNILRLKFDELKVSSNLFMNLILNTPKCLSALRGIAIGTTSVAAIYNRDLATVCVPVPSKSEQEAIAGVLSDADALIDSLEQLIAKKRLVKQGAMQDLLTGKRRLPGFEGEWEVKRLGEVVGIRNERINPQAGQHSSFCVELEHLDQGSGLLLGHTKTSETSSLKCVFQKGDVLFGKLRSYLRKYWHASQDGVCSTEIWVLKPSGAGIVTPYLYQVVQTDTFIETTSLSFGTHMPRSDWKVVRELELRLPPAPEQTAIAAILSDMDAEIAALEAKLAKARQVKQGLMQELLTGRTRLR